MKTVILLILFILPAGLIAQNGKNMAYLPGDCTGFIDINGETNLSNFHLNQVLNQQLYITAKDIQWSGGPDTVAMTEIHIPVKQFSTGNPFLYRDFLELVKADEHPEIIIQIPDQQLENILNGKGIVDPEISITLAGITRYYKIECIANSCTADAIFLRGEKQVKLTDFNIEPPVKSLGLVRVKNDLIINFGFSLALMNETTAVK